MEMTVPEEEAFYSHKLLAGTPHHTDCRWERGVSQEQGLRGDRGPELELWLPKKEWTKEGKQM